MKTKVTNNYVSDIRCSTNTTYIIESDVGYFTIDNHLKKFKRFEDAKEVSNDINKGVLGMNIKSIQYQVYVNNKLNKENIVVI